MTQLTISHYSIIKKLGAGGMGEVYLAEDTILDRKVALKILPQEFTGDESRFRRFIQEAKSASALNHPNIITIHEIGEENGTHFIATEFIDGFTLRNWKPAESQTVSVALDIAAQVASALAAAHAAGIVHRDIKPENVMVRSDGLVKVLDFGLAKLIARPSTDDTSAPTRIKVGTDPGTVVGTAGYMSPEQARGQELDARTDIFSFGVLVYEMITGRPPFDGSTPSDLMASILTKQPLPLTRLAPEAPAELERIVSKSLEKNREERYQSIKDLLLDLKRLNRQLEFQAERTRTGHLETGIRESVSQPQALHAATAGNPVPVTVPVDVLPTTSSAEYLVTSLGRHKTAVVLITLALAAAAAVIAYFPTGNQTIRSVAVLPFINAGADPDTEYLSDGITESLINSLAQLPNLTVMSRDSVFRYKGHGTSAQAAGRELNVQAVLTGRVVQRGDTLSISADLVDVDNNRQLWGEQYTRKISDILAVQEEISREISDKLRLRLTGDEQKRLVKRYTDNTEAYQLYLKGRYHSSKITEGGLKKGIEYFQQAIEMDPSYALAYAGLADSYMNLGGVFGFSSPREYFPKAKAAALKALEFDETLAEAHASLATAKLNYEWNWTEAEREFKRAFQLNPNHAEAHQSYGTLLESAGRFVEAIAERQRAQQLDPLSPHRTADVGYPLYYARRYEEAIEYYRKALELEPTFFWSYLWIGQAEVQLGKYQEAIADINRAAALSSGNVRVAATLGHALAISGNKAQALQVLKQLEERARNGYVSPYYFALLYTGLGEKDLALEWLEKAYEERQPYLILIKVEPVFDVLHSDPRFQDLLRRIGLS